VLPLVQAIEKELGKTDEVELVKNSLWRQGSFGNLEETSSGIGVAQKSAAVSSEAGFAGTKDGRSGGFEGRAELGDTGLTNRKTEGQERVCSTENVAKRSKVAFFQVHNSFIIEETDDGLNIIDQHALHEIILFHEIERSISASKPLGQRLLIHEVVELNPKDFFNIISLKGSLGKAGVEIEEFGQGAVVIRAFPQILRYINAREFIENVVSELGDEYFKSADKVLDKIISVMACKGAVKAGQKLEPLEIESLLNKRKSIDAYTQNCPHGRPTVIHFSLDELQRQFKRK
jgi:DNA mismatch repair protein MutL